MLKSKSQLDLLPDESTDVYQISLIDTYQQQPAQSESETLADFAGKYDVTSRKRVEDTDENFYNLSDGRILTKMKTSRIIRYVRFSLQKDPENNYRELIMLFLLFRDEDNLSYPFSTFKEKYEANLSLIEAKRSDFEFYRGDIEQAQEELSHSTADQLDIFRQSADPDPDVE